MKKKIIFTDATSLYGHSMSQVLPYDESEMWNGHLDLYMDKLEELLKTPDNSDIGYFVGAELNNSENKKKRKISRLLLKIKVFQK